MRLISFVLLSAAWACAQTARPLQAPDNTANLPAQKIGARDLINIQVYDSPELSRTVRVGADGLIRMPMLKQRVKAEGLMPSELEIAVGTALEEEQLLVEPFVTITVAEYTSRPVSVAGAVRTPLTFQANSPVTLLEALTRAGGLSSDAGSEILISRPASAGGSPAGLTQRVAVKALIHAADPEANIKLSGGEEIRVPEAGKIFVVGNVRKPGAFLVQDGAETSVLKMLALAEGLTPFSGKQAYILRREASGNKSEIPIELAKIMQRKAPDAPLQANDVLYIPDNSSKRLGIATLEKILMLGSSASLAGLVLGR
jgi:polysaccharide biosynthesis/export protein